MLTYRLVNNLKKNEDAQWQELANLTLGKDAHPSRQRGFCLAREALRQCLFERGFNLSIGQLQLENYRTVSGLPSLSVSLSHTSEWGAAIVGDKKQFLSVGIDVEPLQRVVKSTILERISHPDDAKFDPIVMWSLKEACFKALMNTGKFEHAVEFSSILISEKAWAHHSSGIAGEWESEIKKGMVVTWAWVQIKT